jgi:hypothetical protein
VILEELTRRNFLQGTGGFVAGTLMRAGVPALAATSQAACSARDAGADFETISGAEAREIIALAARIIPTTDTPGATEAGAVYFFDQALGSFFAGQLEAGRMMLAEFQSGVAAAYPGAERFSDLDEADQDAYLKANEQTPFFQGVRFFTIFGVFCLSKYGGNRDDVGWKLIGMDGPPHAWSYPFGYYDAEYMKEQESGE